MKRGTVKNIGATPAGAPVDVIEWLDEHGNVVGYTVEVDGVEVGEFDNFDDALAEADRQLNPPPPSP